MKERILTMNKGTKRGQVKWFNKSRGYGFVTALDDKKDYFIHYSCIDMQGYKYLNSGDIVDFEVGTTDKNNREQAVNVRRIFAVDENGSIHADDEISRLIECAASR